MTHLQEIHQPQDSAEIARVCVMASDWCRQQGYDLNPRFIEHVVLHMAKTKSIAQPQRFARMAAVFLVVFLKLEPQASISSPVRTEAMINSPAQLNFESSPDDLEKKSDCPPAGENTSLINLAETVAQLGDIPPPFVQTGVLLEYKPPLPSKLSKPVFFSPHQIMKMDGEKETGPHRDEKYVPSVINSRDQNPIPLTAAVVLEAFAWKYMTPFILSKDITLIQSCNNLGRFLGLYHDPKLTFYLDQNGVAVENFIERLVMHFFSCDIGLGYLIRIWDWLLVGDNVAFPYYVSILWLIRHRKVLMSLNKKGIVDWLELNPITIRTLEDLIVLLKLAEKMDMSTPASLKAILRKAFSVPGSSEALELLKSLKRYPCLPVSAGEISRQDRAIRYFVVDCRSKESYESGHLPTAFFFDTEFALKDQVQFKSILQGFHSMIGTDHIVLYGTGHLDEDVDLNTIIFGFLGAGFVRVSVIDGGFQKIHELYDTKQIDLVPHEISSCGICQQKTVVQPMSGQNVNLHSFVASSTLLGSKISAGIMGGFMGIKTRWSETRQEHTIPTADEQEPMRNVELPDDFENINTVGRSVPTDRLAERGIGESFICEILGKFGRSDARTLVLTQRSMIVCLRPHPTVAGLGIVDRVDSVADIGTLGTSPSDPSVLMIEFKPKPTNHDVQKIERQVFYRIPDARDFILGIKYHRKRLRNTAPTRDKGIVTSQIHQDSKKDA
eukprot:TRINITY_DN672_c0_g1_i6.p1 TRINITY_DN672_c0_g1~~TRINITY_DN672_c0_g1_i6.p1  ORF type:complete len:724 (+),score=100.14 TRINITY_DN672_c0_g1_i6:120-2291(+)